MYQGNINYGRQIKEGKYEPFNGSTKNGRRENYIKIVTMVIKYGQSNKYK